MAVSTLLQIF